MKIPFFSKFAEESQMSILIDRIWLYEERVLFVRRYRYQKCFFEYVFEETKNTDRITEDAIVSYLVKRNLRKNACKCVVQNECTRMYFHKLTCVCKRHRVNYIRQYTHENRLVPNALYCLRRENMQLFLYPFLARAREITLKSSKRKIREDLCMHTHE